MKKSLSSDTARQNIVKAQELTRILKNLLTDDLLKKGWTGHCYLFAEAFYHLFGKKHNWKVKCHKEPGFETHWWIEAPDGTIFDHLNNEKPFPYHLGKGKGFLTKEPSKRCLEVMRRYYAQEEQIEHEYFKWYLGE